VAEKILTGLFMYFSIMAKRETLDEFYKAKFNVMLPSLQRETLHFNVFRLEEVIKNVSVPPRYSRRDFYKITLIRGTNICHYADKSIEVNGSTLIFFNSHVPYTWESVSGDYTGYFCIFKEGFFTEKMRENINNLPMFRSGGKPSYTLNETQDKTISEIFIKMLAEAGSDYEFKADLLRNYVTELIHQAMKMTASEKLFHHADSNARITAIFTDLLENQFPIDSPSQRCTMRSPKDFANQLAVHVNHLNRAVKTTTGKTTTDHIKERVASEAIALLKHTRWNISEISYTLGFEDPAHFTKFFKKHTHQTPSSFRST
jgi:AraC family transcriptional regulator, transcriptional activator of pobA